MLMRLNAGKNKKSLLVMKVSGNYPKLPLVIGILLALFTLLVIPYTSSAQEMDYPVPLKPDNETTGVKVNIIAFSWKPFSTGTELYRLEISKNQDISNPVFSKGIPGTSYSYNEGKLEYNTTYFWRVTAIQPLGGNPSPPFKFTTEKNTGTPAPAQGPPTSQSSDSFIDYLMQNPLLLVTLAGGIIIIAVALYIASRPRKKPFPKSPVQGAPSPQFAGPLPQSAPPPFPGQPPQAVPGQFMSPPPQATHQFFGATSQPPPASAAPQQAGILCQQCNTTNTPGRKFCSNCGGNLMPVTTPPPPQQNQGGVSSQANTCPSCGTVNTPGRKFCSNCGSTLALPATPPQQTGQSGGTACPSCGMANSPERTFCSNCGATLGNKTQQQSFPPQSPQQQAAPPQDPQTQPVTVIEKFSCPICGTIITRGSNPCPKCGTEFDWRTS